MQKKVKCWEVLECNQEDCPAHKSKELRCWLISGTHCRDAIQGKFLEKMEMCLACEPFKKNMDVDSMQETLKVLKEQFSNFKQMVERRDEELEDTSMELALGLSEVFEALRKISSGDPEVRIPETSELELITKLKRMVNLTAIDLAGIVNLSHEFAIGLAEHFDVLHRVSKGDLTARVSGMSQVELLESLKKVTNQMIQSVFEEMTKRELAEEALQRAHNQLEIRVEQRTAELKREIAGRKRVEHGLRESEKRFRDFLYNLGDIAYEANDTGELTYVNKTGEIVAGVSRKDIIGKSFLPLFTRESQKVAVDVYQRTLNGESPEYELSFTNGRICHFKNQPQRDKNGKIIGVFGTARDITDRKVAEQNLSMYHDKLRIMASKLSLAEERERRRIATEVHDRIGQNLAFAKIKLGTLMESDSSSGVTTTIDEVSNLVDEAIQDTRSLVSELGSPILYELGFVPAVEWLTQQVEKRHDIAIDLDDDGQPKLLSDDIRVLLFQAVRELLANVVRHAQARTAKVSITRAGDQIQVDVSDDGIGFDPAEIGPSADQNGRFGLFSIRERLEPLGGHIEVASKPGQGSKVTLIGPLEPPGQKDTRNVS